MKNIEDLKLQDPLEDLRETRIRNWGEDDDEVRCTDIMGEEDEWGEDQCFETRTHTFWAKCRHSNGSDFVPPPDGGDGVVLCFQKGCVLLNPSPPKCRLGFSRVLKDAIDKVICKPDNISCWISLLALPLCLLKTFRPRSSLECKSVIKRQRQEESIANAVRSWGTPGGSLHLLKETLAESSPTFLDVNDDDLDLGERNIKQCKRKIYDGHYTAAVRILPSSGVAPYNEATLEDLKTKPPFHPAPSLPHIPTDHHHLIASSIVARLVGEMMLGEYIVSAPLTPLVKPDSGIRPIAMGTVWRRLVSKVSAIMIGYSLDGYLDGLQFGVRVAGGSEAILHFVNRLIEDCGDDVGLSMLLVDFKNAFNLVDREAMLREVHLCCPAISLLHPLICKIGDSFSLSLHAWYLDDGTIVRDTMVVGKVLELIMEDGPGCGLHLNVDKTKLVTKRVAKTIGLMDAISKINDPQCELLLLRSCTGIFRLYFTMRTCPPRLFESAQRSFDRALRSSLERIITASGPGFSDWQWRLMTLPFSADLQTKLLLHTGIVSPGPIFDDALSVFNTSMKTGLLSNPSEIVAPKLMKKMVDIYFTRVTKNAESTFSLSSRHMALWTSQREDHTSDWLRTIPISELGQTMNGKTYRCVLCYRLGVLLFSGSKPCSACSRVFAGDIYGDHDVSCAGIIGIKHRHNVVRDTLVDICYRSRISAGKEVDIGLDRGRDKPLRPTDILLYSWDGGLDVCMDLTGSSPLTHTGMVDFVLGRAVIDVAQRKRGKYMNKCAAIGYEFLPLSFSSLGELEADAVILLKRTRKFYITQDIEARATIHIFNDWFRHC
ncbi:hypothetical protein Tco_0642058 [Tanacetum coccineum]